MASDNLKLAFSLLSYGACLLDDASRIVLSNRAFCRMFDLRRDTDGVGRELAELIAPFRMVGSGDPFRCDRRRSVSVDLLIGERVLEMTLHPAEGCGCMATFEDVTRRRSDERTAQHRIRHDRLTGLPNREALDEHIAAHLARGAPGPSSVFHLDLDRYRLINEAQGSAVGDKILVEVAQRIRASIHPDDFVCRLEGDDFVVVAASVGSDQVRYIGERLRHEIGRPVPLEDRSFDIQVSIGIASSADTGATLDETIADAGSALFHVKRDGGGVCLYNDEIGLAVRRRRTLEQRLRLALTGGEFHLFYQPIMHADGRDVTGFEALIRWTQSSGAMVPPDEFIPLAEEMGLMPEIGGWVLEAACREAATWPAPTVVAVNVSATQLHDPRFIDRVAAALDVGGLDPRRLEIEITETAMIKDHASTLAALVSLRDMGLSIAIDDFGTGYSSLSKLRTLPFTRLKIDRSFVSDMASNSQSMAIVRAVMWMSRDLGLLVTAEGVETEEQRLLLLEHACHDVQGYLFARPMPRERIPFFLAGRTDRMREGPSSGTD